MTRASILLTVTLLAGCANTPDWLTPRDKGAPQAEAPAVETPVAPSTAAAVKPPKTARTVDDFDTSTEADKTAAKAQSDDGKDLGVTIASLGAAGEPGFWLKTPLVSESGPGRVAYPAKGTSAKVDLLPLDAEPGAGSRMSLAAMRVLEAPLTGLPEVRVFALK